jgi:hypothetical protein
MNKLTAKGLALVLLLGLGSCARNPVTGRKDFVLLSEQQEIAMGQQSDPSIVAEMGLYEDKTLQSFINEKGQQMAKVSHRPELKYEFKIVDSPIVNAFAVPGGYVYFTRGIMAHFNNEAEFAGVLGHEIGHITARHSAKQYSKAMLAQVGLIAGMVVSPQFGSLPSRPSRGWRCFSSSSAATTRASRTASGGILDQDRLRRPGDGRIFQHAGPHEQEGRWGKHTDVSLHAPRPPPTATKTCRNWPPSGRPRWATRSWKSTATAT